VFRWCGRDSAKGNGGSRSAIGEKKSTFRLAVTRAQAGLYRSGRIPDFSQRGFDGFGKPGIKRCSRSAGWRGSA